MSIADILIIYLAFGSPLMVHRYLTNFGHTPSRRVAGFLFALAFWVPLIAQMGYRYLSNAYSKGGFVSKQDLDAVDQYVSEMRSALKPDLVTFGTGVSGPDFFETLERYIALAAASRNESLDSDNARNLFDIAGTESEIGTACLVRRNRRRIKNHHIRARWDLLELLGKISDTPSGAAAVVLAIRIARQLDDSELERALADEEGVDRSWITEQQSGSEKVSTTLSSLTIAITPPSSD